MNSRSNGAESGAADAELDRSPGRVSGGVALLAAALFPATLDAFPAVAPSALGALLVGYGAVRGSRAALDRGGLLFVAAVVVGGLQGVAPAVLLVAALAGVVAWDAGHYGVTVGEQLGRAASTARAELVHATLTAAVGAAGVAVGAAAFALSTGGRPVAALFALLVGVVALVVAVGRPTVE